mgnify:CR=1 FL=1
MFVSVLTKDTPSSDSFTINERTLVQVCVLGGSNPTGQERLTLQVYDGSDFRYYRLTIKEDKPNDFYLAAGTYRAHLDRAGDDSVFRLMLSPVVAD